MDDDIALDATDRDDFFSLRKRMTDRTMYLLKEMGFKADDYNINEIDFDDLKLADGDVEGDVNVTVDPKKHHCGCCDHSEYRSVPGIYLFDKDWRIREELRQEKERKAREKREKEQRARIVTYSRNPKCDKCGEDKKRVDAGNGYFKYHCDCEDKEESK